MSVLTNVVVVPSRMAGVYRFLTKHPDGVPLEEAYRSFMPSATTDESTKEPRNIIEKTVVEGANAGLWTTKDNTLILAGEPEGVDDKALRTVIEEAIWAEEGTNDDLGRAIAWFLAQDPLDGGWTLSRVEEALLNTPFADEVGITKDTKYGSFRDWVCYLGFGWQVDVDGSNNQEGLLPDPTAYLRRRLPDLFDAPSEEMTMALFMRRLAALCPVFETGRLRRNVDDMFSSRPDGHVAASTNFALNRLERSGILQVDAKADAPNPRVIQRGSKAIQASHVTWTP
jgi:hypothetical protein